MEYYHSGQSKSDADNNSDTKSDSNTDHYESDIIKLNVPGGGEKIIE